MIYSTATVSVNRDGETKLSREQVWMGLEWKARDARLFLPPDLCTRCDVVEESATHLVREATIAREDLREIITLEPERKVTFFQATGPREGAIVNELFEDEHGALQLRFYCYLGLRGKEPAGPEEQAEQAQFDSDDGYKAALLSTLKRTRELLAGGKLRSSRDQMRAARPRGASASSRRRSSRGRRRGERFQGRSPTRLR